MKKYNKYTYILLAALSLASCEKTVNVEPKNFIAPGAVTGNIDGLQNVLNSAYDRFQDFSWYGNGIILIGDILADNAYTNPSIPAGGNRYIGQNQNVAGNATTSNGYNYWSIAYTAINDINLVLANIDNVQASDAVKAQVKGEAYGLRALAFFDLARAYSYEPTRIPTTGTGAGFNKGVVLRLKPTTDATSGGPQVRATVEETYAQIESDFKQSINLLPAATASKFRMNKSAAYALLGRTYLYWAKYANAVTQFDLALNSGSASLAPAGGYGTQFNRGLYTAATESFMEIAFNNTVEITGVVGSNSTVFSYTQPTGKQGGTTFGGQTLSDELVALFEPTDDRKSLIFSYGASSVANTPTSPMFNWSNKYNSGIGNNQYTDNVKVIRYADVLLMKAEALAEQGQYAAAAALVVQLRTNRNASVTGVPTDASIIPYILTERRRELFFEGQRFFDLKRKGLDITKPAKIAGGTVPYTDRRILNPIPAGEVNNVPGLPQNPGY